MSVEKRYGQEKKEKRGVGKGGLNKTKRERGEKYKVTLLAAVGCEGIKATFEESEDNRERAGRRAASMITRSGEVF